MLLFFFNTNGFSKQYRCLVAFYLLSTSAHNHNITIKHLVGDPGHKKGYIDFKKIVMLINKSNEENCDIKK